MHFFFAKYHGAGNDFIIIDNRQEVFPADEASLIKKLCMRQFGIGADGLILLQSSQRADYWMRVFNSDGSEAEMCGNGLRCFLRYLHDSGEVKENYRILVDAQIYEGFVNKEKIGILMEKPKDISWNVNVSLFGKEVSAHYLNTGVPHAVIFVEDVSQLDVDKVGKEIRWHPIFQPKGVNVDFASLSKENQLTVRTFERGVEAETLACGTGAAAVAFAAAKMQGISNPLQIQTLSKEILQLRVLEDDRIETIGGASFVFKGHFSQKKLCCINV